VSKLSRIWLILALVVLLPVAGQAAQKELLAVPRNDLPGLTNFAKVSDGLYRGAQPEPAGLLELKKMGVKTIINLRAKHTDEPILAGLGFKYVSIPISSWNLDEEDVVSFLQVVTNPANQPVFVHCQYGSDRVGVMVAVYRMYAQNWGKKDALAELNNFGFHEVWVNLKSYLNYVDLRRLKDEVNKAMPPEIKVVK